ncbi:SDR family NAD(P)-dependent oxidoreductase [Sphingobium agri]|uniref:SDR family oxidoreductase n=1 Tax=Sphingobium agri TaxID=2933566 RepID=A0ABT0DSW0_9SPHN|nr:SDR family oxidoreductase [Sphingobium agri]MCK0530134.1 SDR family oxidoreductase [Sphingobium agri]
MTRLAGKVAIVTGAAAGIGAAIAERLVAEGAQVLLTDMNEEAGQVLAQRLGQRFLRADMALTADREALFDDVASNWGRLDILVNNAGITHAAELDDLTEEGFDRVMAVNVKAATFATQAAARLMRKGGSIINLSSVNALLAIPNQIAYAVSKGAIRQLTNVTAVSLAPRGIRVNAIGPGTIMTEMGKSVMAGEEQRRLILSRTPLGRVGDPEEIASIAAFLASDDASYITGQTIYADGGRLGLNYTMPG